MTVSYDSIGQVCVTCINTGASANAPCKVCANNAVGACLDGEAFQGVIVAQHSNLASVVVKGFVTLPYAGNSAPTLGYCPLAATGTGKVKKLDGAHEYPVFQVDSVNRTVTFCL